MSRITRRVSLKAGAGTVADGVLSGGPDMRAPDADAATDTWTPQLPNEATEGTQERAGRHYKV